MTNDQLDLITVALDKLHDEVRGYPDDYEYTLSDIEKTREAVQRCISSEVSGE